MVVVGREFGNVVHYLLTSLKLSNSTLTQVMQLSTLNFITLRGPTMQNICSWGYGLLENLFLQNLRKLSWKI